MSAAAKYHVAPVIRSAVLKAMDIVAAKQGKTIPELVAFEIEDKGLLYVLDKLGKYVERDSRVELAGRVQHTHGQLSETAAFLREALGKAAGDALPEPGEERPLLPH